MTAFNTIYDAVNTLVSTTLTSYTKAPKSIIIEENPSLLMNKGYVITWENGNNTERFVSCKLSISRLFSISLFNRVISMETNVTQVVNQEKALIDDQLSLLKAFEKDPTLSGAVASFKYVSDGGLEYLSGERINYYLLQSDIEVEYIENL